MHKLRFTGSLTKNEFSERVAQEPWWYHSYYFSNGYEIRGDYNIGADIANYGFPASMAGMKVLDIGSGSGWFSTYFAQQGAEVTAVDARGYSDFDIYGRFSYPPLADEKPKPDRVDEEGKPIYFSAVNSTFWLMKDMLGTPIRFKNARVYEVSPALFDGEMFDLVFMGALLLHLRDPIGALMAARSVCRGQLIASTPVVLGEPETNMPCQYLPYTEIDHITWWLPNAACFKHWFLAAGFRSVDISRKITLRMDKKRFMDGRVVNGDQTHRVGHAFV